MSVPVEASTSCGICLYPLIRRKERSALTGSALSRSSWCVSRTRSKPGKGTVSRSAISSTGRFLAPVALRCQFLGLAHSTISRSLCVSNPSGAACAIFSIAAAEQRVGHGCRGLGGGGLEVTGCPSLDPYGPCGVSMSFPVTAPASSARWASAACVSGRAVTSGARSPRCSRPIRWDRSARK